MKTPFKFRAPAFDVQKIDETIRTKLAAAGLQPKMVPMRSVTDAVRRSLAAAKSAQKAVFADKNVIETVARVVDVQPRVQSSRPKTGFKSPLSGGSFLSHAFTSQAGTRAYKLYVPARISPAPALLVMLHGCTQSADDFAAGTRMNQLADAHGFLVVYPEQSSSANPSKCWNWFKAQDQVRASGEPSLIVGIVQDVAARFTVNPGRIFVAGMSAGAAMAVILAETYPDIFAAVGVHSGLPYRSANDISSAMLAMKGGRSGMPVLQTKRAGAQSSIITARHAVPTIVFHGDQDHTVQLSNAIEIVRQANHARTTAQANVALKVSTEQGTGSNGRSYIRSFYTDASGQSQIEYWTVHGAGHAWSGGDVSGSYTDASGPDASVEMLRFFLSLA